jgi:hypothetical protein
MVSTIQILAVLAGLGMFACGSEADLAEHASDGNAPAKEREQPEVAQAEDGNVAQATALDSEWAKANRPILNDLVGEEMAERVLRKTNGAAVTSLTLPSGNSVSWHEVAYGSFVVLELGEAELTLDQRVRSMGAAELYTELSGKAAPGELVSLDERVEQMLPIYETIQEAIAEYPSLARSSDRDESSPEAAQNVAGLEQAGNEARIENGFALQDFVSEDTTINGCENSCDNFAGARSRTTHVIDPALETGTKRTADSVDNGLGAMCQRGTGTGDIWVQIRVVSWTTVVNHVPVALRHRILYSLWRPGIIDMDVKVWYTPGADGVAPACLNGYDY